MEQERHPFSVPRNARLRDRSGSFEHCFAARVFQSVLSRNKANDGKRLAIRRIIGSRYALKHLSGCAAAHWNGGKGALIFEMVERADTRQNGKVARGADGKQDAFLNVQWARFGKFFAGDINLYWIAIPSGGVHDRLSVGRQPGGIYCAATIADLMESRILARRIHLAASDPSCEYSRQNQRGDRGAAPC